MRPDVDATEALGAALAHEAQRGPGLGNHFFFFMNLDALLLVGWRPLPPLLFGY